MEAFSSTSTDCFSWGVFTVMIIFLIPSWDSAIFDHYKQIVRGGMWFESNSTVLKLETKDEFSYCGVLDHSAPESGGKMWII